MVRFLVVALLGFTLLGCPGPAPEPEIDGGATSKDVGVAPGPDASEVPGDAAVTPGPDASAAPEDAAVTPGPDASAIPEDAAVTPGPDASAIPEDAGVTPGPDAGPARADAGPPAATCVDLATLTDPATQVAVVVADGSAACTDRFVSLLVPQPASYVDAFIQLVGTSQSSHLFYSMYPLMPQMRWGKAANDALYAGMQASVDSLPAGALRSNWDTYFVGALNRGEFYLCPSPLPTGGPALVAELSYTDYACTEEVAQALAPVLAQAELDLLLANSQGAPRGWARRNCWRTVGRHAEKPAGQDPRLLLDANVAAIRASAAASLATDPDEDALADVIWVLDAGFFPSWDALAALQGLALDAARSSPLRFRAAAAASRLVTTRTGTVPTSDVDWLIAALGADDYWVRAEAAYTCEVLAGKPGLSPSPPDDARLGTALDAAYAVETVLVAQAYEARAIDARQGTALSAALRTGWEAAHLGTGAAGTGFTVRSGLTAAQVAGLVTLLEQETAAFADLLGPTYATAVPGDANATATVVVFATMQEYRDYMEAFVGYGAAAGGLFVEGTGTLYTYERTPAQSSYTLRELLQHEYAHRLNARAVFPGQWGAAGYFDEAKGWADEGTAEFFAGVDFTQTPYDAAGLRPGPLSRLCAAPPRALPGLLLQRTGYDQPGTFDYDNAWAFLYFMMHPRRPTMVALFDSLRADSYRYAQWQQITGVSVPALEAEWHAALSAQCAVRTLGVPVPPVPERERVLRVLAPPRPRPARAVLAATATD